MQERQSGRSFFLSAHQVQALIIAIDYADTASCILVFFTARNANYFSTSHTNQIQL